jgi:ABC-type uncharacterized transport system involved in gliding motility auxiliary subunit
MAFFESFRAVRWIRTLNLVLQAVLFLTFFAGLNWVARNHPGLRFDLTQYRKFTLSPETLSYVRNLPRPVEIVVTLGEDNDDPSVRGLLDEYVHATEGNPAGRITTRYIDVYKDRREAERYGIDQANALLLRSGDKTHALLVSELYRMKDKQREAFIGEQQVTDALLDVSSSERKRIYFIVGHGELHPLDTDAANGLSLLRDALRSRNFQVDTLELAINPRIPEDAALVVAVSPRKTYTRAEQEMLRRYLRDDAGRLILFLDVGRSAAALGLDDLLLDWGVLVDDDVIIDPDPQNITEDFDLIVRSFNKEHPTVQSLTNRGLYFRWGPTRSVRVDPGANRTALKVAPLAATSKLAWGEVAYTHQPVTRDNNDIRPMPGVPPEDALSVAVASERVSTRENLPFSVRGGRLVVFGTGDAVSNRRLGFYGNFDGFLGAVNWAVDRERQLNVPARPIERFQLALSAAELQRLNYTLWFGLPGATLLLGLVVYWTRRA